MWWLVSAPVVFASVVVSNPLQVPDSLRVTISDYEVVCSFYGSTSVYFSLPHFLLSTVHDEVGWVLMNKNYVSYLGYPPHFPPLCHPTFVPFLSRAFASSPTTVMGDQAARTIMCLTL